MLSSVAGVVAFGIGMLVTLILAFGAYHIAMSPMNDSDKTTRRGIAGGLGFLAALIAILSIVIVMNSGPPTAQDLCTQNTYNKYPQGIAECVRDDGWPWDRD